MDSNSSTIERNYLKNPSGEEGFKHWCFCRNLGIKDLTCDDNFKPIIDYYNNNKSVEISQERKLWTIENGDEQLGSRILTNDNGATMKNFATSHEWAQKFQVIDLYEECPAAHWLDQLYARVEVSEKYVSRSDCGCQYALRVYLVNDQYKMVDSYKFNDRFAQGYSSAWKKAGFVFNISKKIRYILFYHGGCDSQFWAGFYGPKMSAGCIRITI